MAANVLLGVVIGVIGGLGSAGVVAAATRTRVKFRGFTSVEFSARSGTGTLHKIVFEVRGRSPGSCCLEIRFPSVRGRAYEANFAKWDEAANPVDEDGQFIQWIVPLGYYQPLVPGRTYVVPIIFVGEGRQEIFSSWWFGIPDGYHRHRAVEDDAWIDLVLTGSGLNWRRTVSPPELRSTGSPRLASPVRTDERQKRFRPW